MLAPNSDMFRTAYQQVTPAERAFVDAVVNRLVETAQRYNRPLSELVDAPIPLDLVAQDTRGWLQRPLVVAAITDRLRDIQHYKDITLDTLVRQLFAIATFSLEEIIRYDEFGDPYFDLANATPDQWAAIESIEAEKSDGLTRSTRTKIKVKRESKLGAIKQLTELLGGPDALNSYLTKRRAADVPQLTDQTTDTEAADAWSRMIGENK